MKSWRDTIAETGIAASHEEAATGWPERMFIWRIAQLQRPAFPDTPQTKALKVALHYDLADAANAGTVPSIEKPMLLEFSGKRRDVHGNTYGEPRKAPHTEWVNEKFLAAADVFAWLKKRGEEPSEYMLAWLAATGTGKARLSRGQERKLTDEQEKEIVRLYDRARGLSVSELARQFHVSRTTIDKILKRANVKISAATPKKGVAPQPTNTRQTRMK